jgi:hypothetical protein
VALAKDGVGPVVREMKKYCITNSQGREEYITKKKKNKKRRRGGRRTRKTNWINSILRNNCLIQHVIEGKIGERTEVMGRRRRRKQLPGGLE